MARRKLFAALAAVMALALIGSACSKKTETTTPKAVKGACTKTNILHVAAGLPGAPVHAAAAFSSLRAQGSKPTVSIGFIGDISGSNSSLVVPGRDAAKLAFEQANAKGDAPVTFKFIELDNKEAKETTAPALAQRLINDKTVMAVIGPAFSGETEAVQPLFAKAGIVHVTQSATRVSLTTHGFKTFFRSVGGDSDQGAAAAKLMKALGCTKAAIIDDKSPYGNGLGAIINTEAAKVGLTVVDRESIAPTVDYTSLVDTLVTKKPDVVFYSGYVPQATKVLKQMRERGVTATFIGGDGDKGANFAKDAGAANAEGVVFTCPCLDPNVANAAGDAKQFASDFVAKYNKKPDIYAAEAWDIAQMYIDGAKQCGAGVTRACMLDFITKIDGRKGLTKTFSWTTDPKVLHEVVDKGVNIYGIKNGEIVLFGPIQKFAS
ncbi:MAG: branched-chain amino acid ABC transporter substrate-binding protein [Actinomycetota bacterium]|nr:branched-chain amino acid ABC transporter substrate-binding protein [Actinomycetota bacterium]